VSKHIVIIVAPILLTYVSFAAAGQNRFLEEPKHSAVKMEKLPAGENILWRDPGQVSMLDLAYGVGGRDLEPKPPFLFVKEDLSGSNPKVLVKDGKDRKWSVKWSEEAHSDVFGSRMAWACGFVAQPEYYVAEGQIRGIDKGLKRAGSVIHGDGYFKSARFQLRNDDPKFLKDAGWSWVNSPFRGSPHVQGLKVLMMLLSDWDNKDARDQDRDSNLAVFQEQGPNGPRYLYFIADWGGSMGKWGGVAGRDKWDAKGFATQTADFVKGVHNGLVEWGYTGQRTEDQVRDIRVSDVQWLLKYLGRITDDQIRSALQASGATPEEVGSFARSLRDRIIQMQRAAGIAPWNRQGGGLIY
jgi:hypothetical protein